MVQEVAGHLSHTMFAVEKKKGIKKEGGMLRVELVPLKFSLLLCAVVYYFPTFNILAFRATITVLTLIKTAPAAGLNRIPIL